MRSLLLGGEEQAASAREIYVGSLLTVQLVSTRAVRAPKTRMCSKAARISQFLRLGPRNSLFSYFALSPSNRVLHLGCTKPLKRFYASQKHQILTV